MGLDAPRVLMLELAERVAAETLLRATPGAPREARLAHMSLFNPKP